MPDGVYVQPNDHKGSLAIRPGNKVSLARLNLFYLAYPSDQLNLLVRPPKGLIRALNTRNMKDRAFFFGMLTVALLPEMGRYA